MKISNVNIHTENDLVVEMVKVYGRALENVLIHSRVINWEFHTGYISVQIS